MRECFSKPKLLLASISNPVDHLAPNENKASDYLKYKLQLSIQLLSTPKPALYFKREYLFLEFNIPIFIQERKYQAELSPTQASEGPTSRTLTASVQDGERLDTSTITSFTTSVSLDYEETLTATATAVTDIRDQPSQATEVVTTALPTVEQESADDSGDHFQEATATTTTLTLTRPKDGSLRLVNGSHRCEGRVEMFYLSQWGTVCDDAWDLRDAKVVCRQLGCGHAMAAWGEARYGQGTGYIFLDNLKCKGNEPSLLRCSHIRWDVHNCDHSEDAGAACGIL
ncbi:Ssc4d [Columba guinea]|nr:Ssc4d [Columba guinea]